MSKLSWTCFANGFGEFFAEGTAQKLYVRGLSTFLPFCKEVSSMDNILRPRAQGKHASGLRLSLMLRAVPRMKQPVIGLGSENIQKNEIDVNLNEWANIEFQFC